MSKHTPGRWNWWTSNSWNRLRSDLGHGRTADVAVPFCNPADGHPDINISPEDMALIAAAPDLLEALEGALLLCELHHASRNPGWDKSATAESVIGQARAAIAKATHNMNKSTELRKMEAKHDAGWNAAAEAAASLVESWGASDIRLAAGELSAQEMRAVKAMQQWFANQIRAHLL